MPLRIHNRQDAQRHFSCTEVIAKLLLALQVRLNSLLGDHDSDQGLAIHSSSSLNMRRLSTRNQFTESREKCHNRTSANTEQVRSSMLILQSRLYKTPLIFCCPPSLCWGNGIEAVNECMIKCSTKYTMDQQKGRILTNVMMKPISRL